MIGRNSIINGDCLEVMKEIEEGSIDMILCDLPYGTTQCSWDTIIPFEPLWDQYKRVIKKNGAIVLFGSEPFSSKLRMSNLNWFKYDWIWVKTKPTGHLDANLKPLKAHELISVFYKSNPIYNPQKEKGYKPYDRGYVEKPNSIYGKNKGYLSKPNDGERYPISVLYYSKSKNTDLHPTQKPVDLCEYLIKTYTNEGDLVLDNCCGSGTTGLAAINTNRDYILIEKDQNYFNIAKNRLEEAISSKNGLDF